MYAVIWQCYDNMQTTPSSVTGRATTVPTGSPEKIFSVRSSLARPYPRRLPVRSTIMSVTYEGWPIILEPADLGQISASIVRRSGRLKRKGHRVLSRVIPVIVGSGISNLRHTARSCTRLAGPWLHAGVIKYVGNIAVLMNRRPVPNASRRRVVVVVVVVVVDVVGGFPHTRGGGHHRDGLVVSELAATPAAFQDGDEAAPVLFVEEGVEDRIYAGVAGTQPLSDRRGDRQDLVLSLRYVAAELDHGEDDVEGQPGEDEQYHDHYQHFHHLHLRFLLYPLHLSVLGVCGYVPAPHLDPYEDVAEGYEDHRQHVTKGQVADQKEQGAVLRMWPGL